MLRRLYEWTMAKAAHRHAEWWLALFAFMEASFFPIPPHPLLGLMCLAEPKKAVRFAAIATIASVAGGMLGYAIGYFLYDTVGTQLLAALGLSQSFPRAACYLREYGAEIIMIKGATPIPFKLLTITAGFIAMPLLVFIGSLDRQPLDQLHDRGRAVPPVRRADQGLHRQVSGPCHGGVRDCRGRRVRGGGDAVWRIAGNQCGV
jgi:membrane protein YqaA with SNARE-associated domain